MRSLDGRVVVTPKWTQGNTQTSDVKKLVSPTSVSAPVPPKTPIHTPVQPKTPIHTTKEGSQITPQQRGAITPQRNIASSASISPTQNTTKAQVSPIQNTPKVQNTQVQNTQLNKPVVYTNDEISEMLSNGYLNITKELWMFLPVGSHVRFFKKGSGQKNERFRPGGFIKKQYVTSEGKRILLMETIRNGTAAPGYITYPIALDDLDEIWKRYPEECFVEIHLIHNSLVHKNKVINDLVARVSALELLQRNKK